MKEKKGKQTSIKKEIRKNINNNMKKIGKQKYNLFEVLCVMLISLIFGIFISSLINRTAIVFEKNSLPEISKIYDEIKDNYYKEVNDKELLDAAINGMLYYLNDNYAMYYTKEQKQQLLEQLDGSYNGIGVEIYKSDNNVIVNDVFSDSPAFKAGIQKQDEILYVDGNDCSKMSLTEISNLIKNNSSEIKIKVKRDNKELEVIVTTNTVSIPSVNTDMFEQANRKIGYISISIFAENTSEMFREKLLELENKNIDSLIIDIRNNSGGHLHVANEILSLFVEEGKPLYQIVSQNKTEIVYDKTKDKREYPIVILTNGASASASEILAACFKEIYKGEILGTKTFGKGTVQTTIELSSGSLIKYTTQTWLSPNGNEINGVGVIPTIIEEYKKIDNQLEKAKEILFNKSVG